MSTLPTSLVQRIAHTAIQCSPRGLAYGSFRPLLPIVVTCLEEWQAEVVLRLKRAVFGQNPPCDAHALAYLVQNSGEDLVHERIYCVMRGGNSTSMTGVWLGHSWYASFIVSPSILITSATCDRAVVEDHVATNKKKAKWIRKDSLISAIVWMLHKPGHNIPLVEEDTLLPPPRSLSQAPPAYPALAPSQGLQGGGVAGNTSTQAQGAAVTVAAADGDGEVFYDGAYFYKVCFGHGSSPTHAALGSLSINDHGPHPNAELRVLAGIIAPLPSMAGTQTRRPPVTFGARADAILIERGVSEADLWKVLAAWVHARNAPSLGTSIGSSLLVCIISF